MTEESIYQLSLTRIPDIGSILTKQLIDYFGTASAIFHARKKDLAAVEGIGEVRAAQIKKFTDHYASEQELKKIEQHQLTLVFITDEQYPQRLKNCADPPLVLFFKGNKSLNPSRIISVIGSRNATDYGRMVTEQLIKTLQSYDVTIVSGLAHGIDAIAHRSALQQQLPTIGVMAHGFKTIYPHVHRSLAKEMTDQGGLLTEFWFDELPDRHHFPQRNRIVAGISDATIVIETAVKGGSMITADLAFEYNRDVFAVPGRIYDQRSTGCLQLIAQNKATAFTSPEQIIHALGWLEPKKKKNLQKKLFPELSAEEQIIISILTAHEQIHVDELYLKSKLPSSAMASAILNLELQNIIIQLPGKRYQLSV
ncbi:MAG: DNA-protecting protein DprA [Chitinophagaceae bacterium]|nr:DNA-protecting protein DprA [Chitinophagaceae bacterium]